MRSWTLRSESVAAASLMESPGTYDADPVYTEHPNEEVESA